MGVAYVGIDVAKATVTAWVAGAPRPLGTFEQAPAGWQALATALATEAGDIHLLLEPTGGYELAVALFALEQGWAVSLVNPLQVRQWARGRGRRAKTDRQDARLLADYGAQVQPPRWQPLAAEVSALDSLLRRHVDLTTMLRQERNRLEALGQRPQVAGAVPTSVARLIGALEEELRQIEAEITRQLAQHPPLAAEARLLRSVPGIGARNVLPLLVLLHRWQTLTAGRGDAKGLVAYVGLDPQPHESGTSVHARATISRLGDRQLRRHCFLGALGAIHGHNPLRAFYCRLVARGKPKMLALVAAARKLLVWAWAVFRRHAPFSPDQLQHRPASHALT